MKYKANMKDYFVGIIILNYNNWEDTINCIESIGKYNTAPIKYIVVDNGSSRKNCVRELNSFFQNQHGPDYTLIKEGDEYLTSLKKYTFLECKNNVGYAQGNNKGLELAYKDDEITHILVLNNDVLFVEDVLCGLLKKEKELPDGAFFSPILYKRDRRSIDYNCARRNFSNWNLILTYLMMYKDLFGYITQYTKRMNILEDNLNLLQTSHVPIELPSGSCMFISKERFERIGGFDPHTFLYFEENILYKKIKKMGLQNYLIPSLHCIHLGAQSTKKTSSWYTLSMQFHSSIYYLEEYGNMTSLQRFCLNVCKLWFPMKIYLKRLLKK